VTPIPASIARPLIDGLRTEVVVGDPAAAARLGLRPLGYREALRRALGTEATGRETAWSDSVASVGPRRAAGPGDDRLATGDPVLRDRRRIAVAAPPPACSRW
jgi:hypothetical protein